MHKASNILLYYIGTNSSMDHRCIHMGMKDGKGSPKRTLTFTSHPKSWPCLTPSQNIPKQEPIRAPPSHVLPPPFAWRGDSPMRAAQQNLAGHGTRPASLPAPLSAPGWGHTKGLGGDSIAEADGAIFNIYINISIQ